MGEGILGFGVQGGGEGMRLGGGGGRTLKAGKSLIRSRRKVYKTHINHIKHGDSGPGRPRRTIKAAEGR